MAIVCRRDIWTWGPSLPFPLYEGCSVGTHLGLFVIGSFEDHRGKFWILSLLTVIVINMMIKSSQAGNKCLNVSMEV